MAGPGRILRLGTNNMPRVLGGQSGRAIRPMGAGDSSLFCTTRYVDTDGNQVWTRDHGATVRDVVIDSSGNIYEIGEENTAGVTLRKRNSFGNELWVAFHGATLVMGALTPSGGIVVGGAAGTGGHTIRQYAADGTLEWSATTENDVITLDCDDAGFVIANSSSDPTFSSMPIQTHVAFITSSGTISSELDYAFNNVPAVDYRPLVCVCFNRRFETPYSVGPEERFYSGFWKIHPVNPTESFVGWDGNSAVSSNPMNIVFRTGTVHRVVSNKSVVSTVDRYTVACTTNSEVITEINNTGIVSNLTPGQEQSLSGGTLAMAIQSDGRFFTASTSLKAFASQSPVSDGAGGWTTPPWVEPEEWSLSHGGLIYGCDVNSSGTSVLGGVRVSLS